MADQEFLASFAVELDEAGIARLQSVLAENTALADSLAAAFGAASASLHAFAEDLGLLPDFSGRGVVTESLNGLGGLSLGLDLSQAFTDYERFTALVKQPIALKASAAGITSAARTALNSVRSLFAAPVTLHVKAEQEGGGTDPGGGPPVKMSAGGRFSRPTEVQVAEDGDAEYIIPVKKEKRAVPLLRRLLSELSPAARERVTNSELRIQNSELILTPQEFKIHGEEKIGKGLMGSVLTGSPAAGQVLRRLCCAAYNNRPARFPPRRSGSWR